MAQYIDKSALVAEIEKLMNNYSELPTRNSYEEGLKEGRLIGYKDALWKINSLEVKDVELEKDIDDWYNTMGIPVTTNALKETARHFFETWTKSTKRRITMEISNEEKATEIAIQRKKHYFDADALIINSEVECYASAIDMAKWKDEQFKNAINEIKANIIESRDNKEYYETNRKTTLNWILRLIDECCESISIQKENKL